MTAARLRRLVRQNPYPHRRTLGFFYGEKMRALGSIAPEDGLADVLEIGGGTSGLTSLLLPSARVVNLDADPQTAIGAQAKTISGTATSLPFHSESFDGATLFDVLEHIVDDQSAAREAVRVVRPGGWLIISCPSENWRHPYYNSGFRRICYSDREMMGQWGHVRRGYSVEQLEDLFPQCRLLRTASYMNPLTVIAHDISFSRLSGRMKMASIMLQYPLTLLGYHLGWPGPRMGVAVAMRKAAASGD